MFSSSSSSSSLVEYYINTKTVKCRNQVEFPRKNVHVLAISWLSVDSLELNRRKEWMVGSRLLAAKTRTNVCGENTWFLSVYFLWNLISLCNGLRWGLSHTYLSALITNFDWDLWYSSPGRGRTLSFAFMTYLQIYILGFGQDSLRLKVESMGLRMFNLFFGIEMWSTAFRFLTI